MAKANFGAGCFWGIEEDFRAIPGVTDVAVGYQGGTADNPTYEQVCSGMTGHTEAVEVDYDPAKVSFDQLLEVFWECHDPTQGNRQGPDVGTQYRSAVFFQDADQETTARASKSALDAAGKFGRPITTEIGSAGPFWRAEDYHQQYIAKRKRGFGGMFR
jgi:peptide-methionine (S)-S-oxide reductase